MKLNQLKKFAQGARRKLMSEVSSRLVYLTEYDDPYIRAHQEELSEIRRQLGKKSREQLIEEAAYTWFNRIVALRYMDLRGYTKVRIVSPQAGQVQPELLFQIKQGRTPKELRSFQLTFDGYLTGSVLSDQPDREIYTSALLGMCNEYSRTLPFLFRKVDEYMAVLLPTDLLSESSIIAEVQRAITEDDVEDVEIIGWLYQFYISEKKDQVFGRPKGEKIKKEDIPAATQLFTPHWIVRYMVENSLGRLWRNNRPETGLKQRMEYYIEGDPEPEYLTINGPEEITLLDPACGSGHILTYAFDLLYDMYEEEGYSAEEIPSLILTNNLYGIDIDTRAAELAAFALTMKARERDRFFFQRGVVPNVIAMEDVSVDLREAGVKMSPQLQEAFGYLGEATNFGSLIPVPAEVQGEIKELLAELDARGDADLFADQAIAQVRSGLRQLGYLARRYHCVVTNPPYLRTSNSNHSLKTWARTEWDEAGSDLYSMFINKNRFLAIRNALVGMVVMDSWMFQPSYSRFRQDFLSESTIKSMVHMPYQGKGKTAMGINFGITTFVFRSTRIASSRAQFFSLRHWEITDNRTPISFPPINEHTAKATSGELEQIPGQPIAYWVSEAVKTLWGKTESMSAKMYAREGLTTGDNDRFLRRWYEVSSDSIWHHYSKPERFELRWYRYVKGGDYRRWYGNLEYVVDWENDGERVRSNTDPETGRIRSHNYNGSFAFCEGITWSGLSSSLPSFRYTPPGLMFDAKAPTAFGGPVLIDAITVLNSVVCVHLLKLIAPTMDFKITPVMSLPFLPTIHGPDQEHPATTLIGLSKEEWDSRESSWDFARSPLLTDYSRGNRCELVDGRVRVREFSRENNKGQPLEVAFQRYDSHLIDVLNASLLLEKQVSRTAIEAYGLENELTDKVTFGQLTLFQAETESVPRDHNEIVVDRQEVMMQFISYGVGCIFGRYSLDKDGLILANAGDDIEVYLAQIPEPSLRPDESGILPITDDNDFADDLPSQWRAFLRAAFGEEHYEENLRFLEDSLEKRLRPYFLKGFYDDHVKRYKKRPIYWLITSPKGTLQALIYLHRYNRDTVNRFLGGYLRPYQQKLEAKRVSAEHVLTGGGSSQSEKTKAQKRIDEIRKALEELSTWERDEVRPLAEKRIELDLDDGVKVNYGKLGAILAKVKGLNG